MTARAAHGQVTAAVRALAARGIDAEEIVRLLSPLHAAGSIFGAISRARAAGHLSPRRPASDFVTLHVRLPEDIARRLSRRAVRDGMRPSSLARVILQREAHLIDAEASR